MADTRTYTTYTTIADALKTDYLPKLQEQIEKGVKTWDLFNKNSEGCKGREIEIKMFKSYPQGVGPAGAGETLPTPSPAGYAKATVSAKRNYGVISFDAMLEQEANAIVDAIDFEMQAMEESLKKELNYQLAFGDGTGARANVASLLGQVITVDDDSPFEGHITDFLYPGMIVDIGTAAGLTATAVTIESIDRTTNEVTIKAGGDVTGVVADNKIYRTGSAYLTADAKYLNMMGLPGMIKSTGVLQGLNPATGGEEWWASYNKDMSDSWCVTTATDVTEGNTLFFDAIQETIDEIELNSIGHINLIYGWPVFLRQYRAAMQAEKRTVNTLAFKEGRKGLAFTTEDGEVALMRDKYLPHKTVYFLDTSKISIKTLLGLHWEEKGGGILKLLERKDVYTAWMKLYAETAITTRNACGYWTACPTTILDYTT